MIIKSFLRRSLAFVKRYFTHPVYILIYGVGYFHLSFKSHARFYSHDAFVEEIKKGRSIIRFGDGEMHIMNGGSIHYQKYEKGLGLAMRKIVKEFNDTSPYIVSLPIFINRSNTELKKKGKFFVWMPAKVMYRILFPKNFSYGDAHFFYYDGFFRKYLESYLLDKHLVVVSNPVSIESFKNNIAIPFKKVSFVATPGENSYSEYERICGDIDSAIANVPEEEEIVLLISTGPTSKQLVYDFTAKGHQALDIGRGLEVFYSDKSIEAEFPELAYGKSDNL